MDKSNREHSRLLILVSVLRWVIPLTVALSGTGYTLFERNPRPDDVLRIVWLPVLVALVCWILMTWILNLVRAAADEHRDLALQDRELVVLNAIGEAAGQSLNLELMLQIALERMIELFALPVGEICILEGNRLVRKARIGMVANEARENCLQLKECVCHKCARAGEIIAFKDLQSEYSPANVPCVREGWRSIVTVPLKSKAQVLGVILLASPQPNLFGPADQRILTAVAARVAMAVENAIKNAHLFQETKHRYETMIALHETSLDIIARLDTTQLLEALLRRGTQLLRAEGGGLALYDDERAFNYATVSYNTEPKWEATGSQPLVGLVGQVIQRGEPIIVNDYPHWPYRVREYENPSRTRMVGVPLKWESHIVGAMVIMNGPGSNPFDEEDVALLVQFADLASIAIKNAELHSQVKQFSQALEQQVEQRTRELSTAKEEIAARSEQLRLLLERTIRAQEEERARIARDMHDDVVQLITSARWEIQTAQAFAGAELKSAARDGLAAAHELLDEIEKQIRRTIYNLHPPILDAVGLASAVESYVNQFRRISGIACRVEISGKVLRLPIQAESSVYHLVEEALANIAAHADATEASVVLDYRDATLDITVEDNGCGFDPEQWLQGARQNGSHLGLLGMQERAKSLVGSMDVESAPGCGTRLIFRIPIER